jgi:hypothetical protein
VSASDGISKNPKPVTFEKRKLSYLEYFHASVGSAKSSLERPRENTLILEGEGMIDPIAFADAVDKAVAVNPAATLKLVGKRGGASWVQEGSKPSIRVIKNSEWHGTSKQGSEFIYATTLSLEAGITCEFILVEGIRNFIIFRNHHAIMDGMGTMHFLADVFNALNGKPLVGTNATFKDTDLMQTVKAIQHKVDVSQKLARPTGPAQGAETGDTWCRFTLEGPQLFLLPRLAMAFAEFTRNFSNDRILISVPVNMRRHRAGMNSTMNYTCVSYVFVEDGDDSSKFQKKLHKQLKNNSEAYYMRFFEYARYLPFAWLDKFMNRTKKNYLNARMFESAMISDMGLFAPEKFSGAGFSAKGVFGVPIPSSTYSLICTMGKNINITLGMPAIYANHGRIEKLVEYINQRLTK